MEWSWSEEMAAGTRVEAMETERSGQSGDRILGDSVVKVPTRVPSWDDNASIGHRRDSDLLKPLPALRLSKRQRKDSKRDISV